MIKKVWIVLPSLLLGSVSFSAEQPNKFLQIHAKVQHITGRTPASTCLETDEVNVNAAIAVTDYSKCSPEELTTIKTVLHHALEEGASEIKSIHDNSLLLSFTMGLIASSRSSLLAIQALGK